MVDDVSSVVEPTRERHDDPAPGRANRLRGAGTGALLLLVFVALPIGLVALQSS